MYRGTHVYGYGVCKKPHSGDPGRGKNRIRDEHPGSFFQDLRNSFKSKKLKFFEADPDSGSGIFLTLDPG